MLGKKSKRTRMGAPKISPALFDGAALGLRIVAALGGAGPTEPARPKARSDPIPIRGTVGPAKLAKEEKEQEEEEDEDDVELSESYTCVISRVGGQTVRKRVYLDEDDEADGGGIGGKFEMNSGVFFASPPVAVGPIPGDFLSSCCLCRKNLHGLDVFMYRGDKAFCSAECRCQQMLSDERKEKCRSEAGKPRASSLSPYLPPLPFDAGVVAA